MKKKEKEILIQEYGLLKNEFLKVVRDGKIDDLEIIKSKTQSPYLCRIIRKVFGSDSELADHFHSVLQSFYRKAPKTWHVLTKESGITSKIDVFVPFYYHEVKLRLMLIDEIIESLS